jgi:hypothetical protein
MEGASSPPNHGGDGFLTEVRQVTGIGQGQGLAFRGVDCPTRSSSDQKPGKDHALAATPSLWAKGANTPSLSVKGAT